MLLVTVVYLGCRDKDAGPSAAEAGIVVPTHDAIDK